MAALAACVLFHIHRCSLLITAVLQNPSTTIPRAVWNNPTDPNRFSSHFVENAGYLRLKVLELGYRFQPNLLGKVGFLQNFRLFVRGVNVFTITKWTGLDPENDVIPPTRQFLFGVNAAF